MRCDPDGGAADTAVRGRSGARRGAYACTRTAHSHSLLSRYSLFSPLCAAHTQVGWHPFDPSMLKVFYATDTAELQPGKNMRDLRENMEQGVSKAVWRGMHGGEAELANPHGLERTSKNGRSVCPLKSTAGKTFGCIVSGPPAVPDELLENLTRQAGPLLEHVWKTEQVQREGIQPHSHSHFSLLRCCSRCC